MAQWTTERTTDEALAELEKAKIPAGPLYSPQQALEDAHIRAAGLLRDTDYPGLPRSTTLSTKSSVPCRVNSFSSLSAISTLSARLPLCLNRSRDNCR
jgi:crotonobetainyl-CoA:carnitine CoA-transferase CaiB-like acyl-CoA transferase